MVWHIQAKHLEWLKCHLLTTGTARVSCLFHSVKGGVGGKRGEGPCWPFKECWTLWRLSDGSKEPEMGLKQGMARASVCLRKTTRREWDKGHRVERMPVTGAGSESSSVN